MRRSVDVWVRRLATGVALVASLLLGPAIVAEAVNLTNTDLSGAEFDAIIGATVTGPNVSLFNFGGDDDDGTVTSEVFVGEGAAAGYYVYTYKVSLDDPAAVNFIQGLTVPFLTNPDDTPIDLDADTVNDTSFRVNDGNPAPTAAAWGSDQLSWFAPLWIAEGQTTSVFGVLSPQVPTHLVQAQVTDFGTSLTTFPSVYAAVPEASTLLLLGTALAGTGALGRRRLSGRS
jgi:hypothetical protein